MLQTQFLTHFKKRIMKKLIIASCTLLISCTLSAQEDVKSQAEKQMEQMTEGHQPAPHEDENAHHPPGAPEHPNHEQGHEGHPPPPPQPPHEGGEKG